MTLAQLLILAQAAAALYQLCASEGGRNPRPDELQRLEQLASATDAAFASWQHQYAPPT